MRLNQFVIVPPWHKKKLRKHVQVYKSRDGFPETKAAIHPEMVSPLYHVWTFLP